MLYRSITERIEQFFEKEKKAALMVTGARQVGNCLLYTSDAATTMFV